MAGSYKTPGVYVEEISKLPPSVAQVETAIPAFIGYTEKAAKLEDGDLIFVPTRITSLAEYEELFGSVADGDIRINAHVSYDIEGGIAGVVPSLDASSVVTLMYYQLQMYFGNGGGPCYIISCGLSSAMPSPALLNPLGDAPAINLDFEHALAQAAYEDEVTILAFADTPLLTDDEYYALYDKALAQCAKLGDRFTIIDVRMSPDGAANALGISDPFDFMRSSTMGNLKYGAAYYPDLKTIYNYIHAESNVTVFAGGSSQTLDTLETSDTLLYNSVKAAIQKHLRLELAPCGAIAGMYARVDGKRGVWKAPANESLNGVIAPLEDITHAEQESLNVDATSGKSINAIRTFAGQGALVWGARTLAGNDNEWRYISVRRFFNMVEESIKKASAFLVFEPNDANTWTKLKSMIDNYLTLLWRQGALAGPTPGQAFFVKVGLGQTMTALDILEGRMIIEIGLAAVRPAEFIILKFSHKMQEA